MFAGLITAPRRIELVDAPLVTLPDSSDGGGNQILFRPQLGCLCGSDLPFFEQTGEYTVELGHSLHEIIGTVVATNGCRFQEGDTVLAVPEDQRGMFEQFVVDEDRAIPLDSRVTIEQALMAQPLGTVICALKKLPGVLDQDVAVVGVPDDMYDEVPQAYVVVQDDCQLTAESILEHCRDKLSKYKIPAAVLFLAEFPRTSVGKIQKHLLSNVEEKRRASS